MGKDKDPKSAQPFIRRDTVVEQAAEGLIEEQQHRLLKQNAKPTFGQKVKSFGKSIYNHENREFLGRDGKACFELSIFYFIFYTLLSAFFIGMLAIFYTTIDPKKPTYYNNTSVMAHRKVNPGMGFRPQYNPEDYLIKVKISDVNKWREEHTDSLDLFLSKYNDSSVEKKTFEVAGVPVEFDYHKIIDGTPCSKENHYGYAVGTPCVLLKMNRIYDWKPRPYYNLPDALKDVKLGFELRNSTEKYVLVKCQGANAFDKDNVGEIDYYSLLPSRAIGGFPVKYYPYTNQENYLSPLVFAHFKNIPRNTLVEVECRLYARNIENDDRLNQRGMTKFELYITE